MNKLLLTIVGAAHLLPHPFGVSPVGAMALYAGSFANRWIAWLVPLMPLALGNVIHGGFDPVVTLFVYAGFAISTLAGRWLLNPRRSMPRYAAAVVSGAVIFYLISNFSMLVVGFYPATATGLAICYLNGLPYLGLSILANGIYSVILFGLHDRLARNHMETAQA